MAAESEFVRPELTFEREFGQYRSWWTRDRRVVGNALSIYLYLLSHRRDYAITQARAQRDLGLGKDAFLAARRRLESAGYLRAETVRWPAGSVDEAGKKIGGQPRKLVFHVLDPEPIADHPGGHAKEGNPTTGRPTDLPVDESGESGTDKSTAQCTDHDLAAAISRGGIPAHGSTEVRSPAARQPTTGHPALKKDQSQEHPSIRTSSSRLPKTPAPAPDHTDETAELLRQLHPRLDRSRLENRLIELRSAGLLHNGVQMIDLLQASSAILGRARATVVDPVAFVVAGIEASPYEWLRVTDDRERPAPRETMNALCATKGHLWERHGWCRRCSAQSPWCGGCDSTTRLVRSGDVWVPCPACESTLEGLQARANAVAVH
ncbi:hypothetical protein [Rathayibacter sp. SD072]|uniref:hypothetical protein n=1 Tax=Rathayibacter sp. SD072 TaxID=2781731 RepID=UPI001A968C85|nr:hypothetical protein [Rathayibacter sp. SD072]MBO0984560.1 hypothetical protein [Rathayibacter sp. SD072]